MKILVIGLNLLVSVSFSWANSIGQKQEVALVKQTTEQALPSPVGTLSAVAGQKIRIGPLPKVSSTGESITYFWSSETGLFEPIDLDFNEVYYTPALSSAASTDSIYYAVTSTSGFSSEGHIAVTISPANSGSQEASGQLTGIYNSSSSDFTLAYTLGAAVTKAWILASTNGSTFSVVSTFDPVTVAKRSGSETLAVAGSGSVSQMYFRLRTQVGTAATEEGAAINVGYTPVPAVAKSTELPSAPDLYINGLEVSQPQVQLLWSRVNDSLNQDNVVRYELERATNADFSGAVLLDAGNNAPGLNMYEMVDYIATGLSDDTTYYFRVRGLNYVGTGPWSSVDSVRINVQDRPVFVDMNPVFPAHLATDITKTPALECLVSDPEGDSFYCAFEIAESPSGPWRYFGHGGQPDYRNVTRLDPSEWNPPLKPNTHYYWRAVVHEEGRNLDYYGGAWLTSPIWEFTTENVGGGYSLTNVTWVSGALRPYEKVVYRVTVTNNGNAPAAANLVSAYHVKNGVENAFAFNGPGQVPALAPGESAAVDVTVYFRDALFTNSSGTTYDNILLTGDNLLRFKTWPDVSTIGVATLDHTVTYVNAGGPSVGLQINGTQAGGGFSSKPTAARGGKFIITSNISDDIRTTRVLYEYRMNPASAWQVLDDYTGNTTADINYLACNHSGQTVPSYSRGVEWTFPGSFPLTSTLQLKVTAYDDVGATTTVTSEPLTIYDGTLTVQAGALQFPAYRLGDTAIFPLSVTKAPGMIIQNLEVYYWTPSGLASRVYYQSSANGVDVPPVLSVTLPTSDNYAASGAFLRVNIRGYLPGYETRSVSDDTDGTFQVTIADLPSPFHTAINVFNQIYTGYPPNSFGKRDSAEALALDWEGDTRVHLLFQLHFFYALDNEGTVTTHQGILYYHVVYDCRTGAVITQQLPDGYTGLDMRVFGGLPRVLLRNDTGIYLLSGSGGGFGAPQLVTTLPSNAIAELAVRNGELLLAYTLPLTQGNGTTIWRNRLQRVLPSAGGYVQMADKYLGDHIDCSADHLNTINGLYSLSAQGQVEGTVASWSGIPMWFASGNPSIAGAYWVYESGHPKMYFYSPVGTSTGWVTDIQDPRVGVFDDITLAIGQGDSPDPTEDKGFKVVVRHNNVTGSDERIKLGSWGQSFRGKSSAISEGKWAALCWNNNLAVGAMGGDIVAPTVQLTTATTSFTSGEAKTLTWTMSDNLGQIGSVKVLKTAGGITTSLATYSDGTLPTSGTFTLSDTAASMIIRIEVYDSAGNRGVAEQVLTRTSSFSILSFSAGAASVEVGTPVPLQWMASPADAFRVYNILIRRQGEMDWKVAGTVTGTSFLLDTSALSGMQELRIESGGVTRDLPHPVEVTGIRFAFDNEGFSPVSGTVYVPATAPMVRLTWASNQAVSPAVIYTVLGRWNGTGNFGVLGGSMEKSLEINASSNTSLEWKVAASWEGQEFVSSVRTATISTIGNGSDVAATVGGRTTVSPWVDLNWTAQPGSETTVIYRCNAQTEQMEELARVEGTSYRDDSVAYGDRFKYTLATLVGGTISVPGAEANVTISPLLPLGISFVNADYQIVAGNENTVSWNPLLPADTAAAFEGYQVYLRRGDGSIVRSDTVTRVPTLAAEAAYAGLEFNQSYVVEVFAMHPNGSRLSTEPARLHFTTGFDTRLISESAIVSSPEADEYGVNLSWGAVANADSYDIFRRTSATGEFQWLGRSSTTEFSDGGVPAGSGASYVVRARNGLMHVDALATAPVPYGQQRDFRITGAGVSNENRDFQLKFNSQYGAVYRVEYSEDLLQWLDLGSLPNGSGEEMSVTVPGVDGSPRYFFRVVKP